MADAPKSMQQVLGKLGSRKRDADLSNYVFDKLPPQARELEEVVLGGMMLDKDAVAEIIDILKPESFYVEAHQHIFEAIHDLFGKSEPVDILTVTEQLRKMGKIAEVGGPFYVTKLTNRVGSTANIEHHARIISERYILRELIKTSNMIIKDAYEETTDVFDLLDKAEQNLFSITEQNLRRSYDTMSNLVQQAIKQLENIKDHQDGVVGVPTGYVGLDRLTSGWQKSDLVIIAARPAMGKTALTLNIARNAAVDFGKGVALFSLEMSSLQLVNRLISSETGISSEKLKKGDLRPDEWVELTTKVDKLAEAPIFIDDTPAINIFELRAKCRRLKMQHDIQLIVIDYLQLMSGGGSDKKSGGNREQEISLISRSLKSIAKELDVPVIALSQLSRAVETRGGDKRPQLSDLRECITGDSLIYLPRTRTYKKVKDLVGKQNFDVLSLDENLKLQRAKCLDVWETGKKKVYEVTTSSGFKIKASGNHPFLTVEGWKKLEELKIGKNVATFEDNDLEKHLESRVKWNQIKSITYIGSEPTYDLHVEKHHNFLSNNFIVHNSGAIEQDADIVMFIYRPEYYGLDQDEDGNPTKGVTELIVSKHRNGALDTVKLRFIPQFTKFEDFSSLDQSLDGLTPLGEIITRESRMNDGDVGRSDEPLPF
ncbi:MAG: replicative DNA helicase [Chitinophagales bacterium]